MKGSEKQVRWAEDIKSKMNFSQLREMARGNEIALRALDYVENIDDAKFWITYRNATALSLMDKFFTTGLLIMGDEFDHRATMQRDGRIILTYSEIVPDGKGGHVEKRTIQL